MVAGGRELSFGETVQLHSQWGLSGLLDATRVTLVVDVVTSDPEIRANVIKSALLNTISLITIYAFDLFLVPLLGLNRAQLDLDEFAPAHWLHRNIGVFYTVLFQIPVVGGALYLNSTWSTVVARRIYSLQHGRSSGSSSLSGLSASHEKVSSILSTNAYRAVLIFTSMSLSFVLGYIPLIGGVVKFLFVCWVNAYYCFEFIWTARGYSLPQRLLIEEERWAYFLAFGFPSAALCMWGSSLANAALFALLFPAFVILAIHAQPVPQHPYAPLPPLLDAGSAPTSISTSPVVPVRLPIFAIPLVLHEALQNLDRLLSSKSAPSCSSSSNWRSSYGLGASGSRVGTTLESIEEGDGAETDLPTINPTTTAARRAYGHGKGHSVAPSGDWRSMAEAARRSGGFAPTGNGNGSATGPTVTRLRAKKLE